MEKSREEIIEKIKEAGVVGAGGAGFPTHIKINTSVEIVIGNGAECEPLLRVDQQLMELFPEKVIGGLKLVMQVTGAKTGIIALKKKYKKAIDALIKRLNKKDNIKLFLLNNFYPAGDEQTLVYTVTGKVIPELGLPLDVGAVVDNVGTLINIYDAVYENKPVTERFVTVTGAVNRPGTFLVSVGTSVKELINLAGGPSIKDYKILAGGPMMGNLISENDVITKTTGGIIVLPSSHYLIRRRVERIKRSIKLAKTLCIQCNTCTENCPRHALGHNIRPHLLMRKISMKSEIDKKFIDAFLCCECGVCSLYACPMNLSPRDVIKFVKQELIKKGIKPENLNKNPAAKSYYKQRKIPGEKLIHRIKIKRYDVPAPINLELYQPRKVRILLSQHIGMPATPVVKSGETVERGAIIGKIPEGKVGSFIHASISGKVTRITDSYIEISK